MFFFSSINKTFLCFIDTNITVSLLNPLASRVDMRTDRDTELKDCLDNKPVLIVVCIDTKRNIVYGYSNLLAW
jgi:hypothetical protein